MPISKAKGLHPEYKNAPPGKKVWLVLRELTRKITVYQKAQNKWKLKIEKLIRFAKCVGMKQSLKTTTRCIGMRAGKFLGVRRILPEFSQTCSKRFCATFAYIFFPRRPWKYFLIWPPKKIFPCFSANVRRYFCQNFQRFCPEFWRFFPVFRYLSRTSDKSKLLRVRLHLRLLHPRLLHHWPGVSYHVKSRGDAGRGKDCVM